MIGKDFKYVHDALEGSDAVVYRTLRALGFEPMLRMCYQEWKLDYAAESLNGHAVIFENIGNLSGWNREELVLIPRLVRWKDEKIFLPEDSQTDEDFPFDGAEVAVWVTPVTTFNVRRAHLGQRMTGLRIRTWRMKTYVCSCA